MMHKEQVRKMLISQCKNERLQGYIRINVLIGGENVFNQPVKNNKVTLTYENI